MPLIQVAAASASSNPTSSSQYEYDVFLSHKRTDSATFCRTLHTELSKVRGYKVFLDEEDNSDLSDLLTNVRKSRCLIFVLSAHIFDSMWCGKELEAAVEMGCNVVLVKDDLKTRWGAQHSEFPVDVVPDEWQPFWTLASKGKSIDYSNAYHAAFLDKLIARLGPPMNAPRQAASPTSKPSAHAITREDKSSVLVKLESVEKKKEIPYVLAALQHWCDDVDVMKVACYACWKLGEEEELCSLLSTGGAIRFICNVLNSHRDNADTIKHALRAIRILCRQDGNERVVAQHGGLPLIIEAIKQHQGEYETIVQGMCALQNTTDTPDNKKAYGSLGTVALIISIAQKQDMSSELYGFCMGALRNLSQDKARADEIVQHQGVPLLVKFCNEQNNDDDGVRWSVQCLHFLYENGHSAAIRDANGVKAIQNVYHTWKYSSRLQEVAQEALTAMGEQVGPTPAHLKDPSDNSSACCIIA